VQSVHNVGKREPREEVIMTAKLTEQGRKTMEHSRKEKESNIVIKALITLLKTQVEGNDDAIKTIEALEKFV